MEPSFTANGRTLQAVTEYRIFGIGELLWDQMPEGRNPGGAPANFAYVTSRLGDRAGVLSRVGSDADGDEITYSVQVSQTDILASQAYQLDQQYGFTPYSSDLYNIQPSK